MKKLTLIAVVVAMAGMVSAQNLLSDPGFTNLAAPDWYGFIGDPIWSPEDPVNFVTATAGTATVTPGVPNELSFYTELIGLASGSYTYSVDASNISVDSGASFWVKEFDAGFNWIGFAGNAPLVDGSNSFSFTATAGNVYQVGSGTTGATTGSYDIANPSVVPEPATIGLVGIAGLGLFFARRRRI